MCKLVIRPTTITSLRMRLILVLLGVFLVAAVVWAAIIIDEVRDQETGVIDKELAGLAYQKLMTFPAGIRDINPSQKLEL